MSPEAHASELGKEFAEHLNRSAMAYDLWELTKKSHPIPIFDYNTLQAQYGQVTESMVTAYTNAVEDYMEL
jgi:GTPase involved in cell partitioning and DNA repair